MTSTTAQLLTTVATPATANVPPRAATAPSAAANWNSPDYFRLLDEANNGSGNSNSNSNSISSNSLSGISVSGNTNLTLSTTTNQTFQQYQIEVNRSDAARPSYETGSNFMLLLEDFGEYFYNYNGTGTSGTNASAGYEFQTNCSVSNSSCVELSGGEYFVLKSYYDIIMFLFFLHMVLFAYAITKFEVY